MNHIAYISVGSNMGDRKRNCELAIQAVLEKGHATLAAQSGFYETEPVDYRDQGWFVNAVIKVETDLEPTALLHELKAIENRLGRTAHAIRFGPRVIDLDIVFFDDLVMETPHLVLPHPRMHQRCFVLGPICDIYPILQHPVLKRTMKQLLDTLGQQEQNIKPLNWE